MVRLGGAVDGGWQALLGPLGVRQAVVTKKIPVFVCNPHSAILHMHSER